MLIVAAALFTTSAVRAQLTVSFSNGTSSLTVNQGVQTVDLFVTAPAGPSYDIVNVIVNLGLDGGTPNYPKISNPDVTVADTVFFGNNSGNNPIYFNDQLWKVETITAHDTVQLSGGQQKKLIEMTLDTSASLGTYTFDLTTVGGDSHFGLSPAGQAPLPFSGTITVVPEVNSTPVVAAVLFCLALLGRRKLFHTQAISKPFFERLSA